MTPEILDTEKEGHIFNLLRKKHFGAKIGLLFLLINVLSSVTYFIPITTASFLESFARGIAKFTGQNIGVTSFLISLIAVLLPLLIYLHGIIRKDTSSNLKLLFLFLFSTLFLSTALFYKDWLSPNFRVDGQQILGLLILPLKTCWIYLFFGLIHDQLTEKKT